jgi:hypothetical protein
MRKLILLLVFVGALGACSTTGHGGRASSTEGQQAERLAGALLAAARDQDPVLEYVTGEMGALEAALARGVPAPDVHAVMADDASLALVPRPEDVSGLSLMHGIHLASYREERHVGEGWRALQGQHAILAGLQARAIPADLGERGVYLRLLAGPFDSAGEALTACRAIQATQNWCAVTAFDGEPVRP